MSSDHTGCWLGAPGQNILSRGEERNYSTALSTEYSALEVIFTADMLLDFYHKMVNNYNQEVKSRHCSDANLRDDPGQMTGCLRYLGIIGLMSSHNLSSNSRTFSSSPRTQPFLSPVAVSPPPVEFAQKFSDLWKFC